ncbi:cytochrome P450 [Rhodococcus opacus]|uniref:Cytochrome P450 n=1 Tax=Rhodococcus opacus TaxID=37919 RepID=A0A2S8IP50_RHOOP|nr:cytochrome P450 [Rhodococcus opacus]PQP16558.1 cytochrome P450 [Rhodococcus opacus]
MTETAHNVDFFDRRTNDCPFPAYRQLRNDSPVWQDPTTGMFVLTRFDDIRAVEMDTKRFRNTISTQTVGEIGLSVDGGDSKQRFESQQKNDALAKAYENDGWEPGPALNARDEPEHSQVRRSLFEASFRPTNQAHFDRIVGETVDDLIDGFIDDGRCEWVSQFAAPMTLTAIMKHVGLPATDLPLVKDMTLAWIARAGLMATPDIEQRAAKLELDFQKYAQSHFERVRREPDDTLLSTIVNTPVPEWNRVLTDEELHGFITTDMMVGGGETTTGALAGGARLLAENPQMFDKLASDPDAYLDTFIEEVVRLEAPVQGMFRQAAEDVELHGVTIPAGSVVNLRFGSANRDERHYEYPDELDFDRKNPRRHLAFGTGLHVCLGNTLARREMYHTFKAMVERFESIRLMDSSAALTYRPNYVVRCLDELHIEFTPRARR